MGSRVPAAGGWGLQRQGGKSADGTTFVSPSPLSSAEIKTAPYPSSFRPPPLPTQAFHPGEEDILEDKYRLQWCLLGFNRREREGGLSLSRPSSLSFRGGEVARGDEEIKIDFFRHYAIYELNFSKEHL